MSKYSRLAEMQKRYKSEWAINISVLLIGKAFDVCHRLSKADSMNGDKVKMALLLRFQFTVEVF